MKKIIAALLFFGIVYSAFGQERNNIDSLFSTLDNNELYITPIFGSVSVTTKATRVENNVKRTPSKIVISSIPFNIDEMVKIYTKDVIMEKLYLILNDTRRDLYANALLYYISGDNKSLTGLIGVKRDEWIRTGMAAKDKKRWDDVIEE